MSQKLVGTSQYQCNLRSHSAGDRIWTNGPNGLMVQCSVVLVFVPVELLWFQQFGLRALCLMKTDEKLLSDQV